MTIDFTRHHLDRSNPLGFQFEFYCDRHILGGYQAKFNKRCSHTFTTKFQPYPLSMASTLAFGASLLVKQLGPISYVGGLADRAYSGTSKAKAFEKAIEEAKSIFKHCGKCSSWVCKDNCWNKSHYVCYTCAPDDSEGAVVHSIFCGECGKRLPDDIIVNFCPHCGGKV